MKSPLTLGSERARHTGGELTEALEAMLIELRQDHQGGRAASKCRESVQALKSLASLYGG